MCFRVVVDIIVKKTFSETTKIHGGLTRLKFFYGFDGKAIAVETEACDQPAAGTGYHGLTSEKLPAEKIADVNFHHGTGGRAHCIGYYERRVRVGSRVQHNAVVACGLGDVVRQTRLVVFLDVVDVQIGIGFAEVGEVLVKGEVTINVNLPRAELAEVDAIGDQNPECAAVIHGRG